MFNKAVFKQTVKANRVLWTIVTAVLTLILVLIIFQFDPTEMQQLMNTLQGAGIGSEIAGDSLLSNSITILGILSQSFYSMIAIIIILVFIIITANSLIAGEVDRGSMAYTLSTPIKRTSVIFTKATYLISSLFFMILIFTISGIVSVQIKYQLIWGVSYTTDIKEIAKQSDYNKEDLENDYTIIYDNEELLTIGAKKRFVSNETYNYYILMKAVNKGLEASSNVMGIDNNDISEHYSELLMNPEALKAGSEASKMPLDEYTEMIFLLQMSNSNSENSEENEKFMENFELVYTKMGMNSMGEAIANLEKILEKPEIAMTELGLEEGQKFLLTVRFMSVSQLVNADGSITFDTWSFVKINMGLFLLTFALSSISFIASAIFNLSKNSFALGAGLPLAFWVLQIVSSIDSSLENFKYLSLNTLFNPQNLMSGKPFILEFIALFGVGVVLYTLSIQIFKKKDLPL